MVVFVADADFVMQDVMKADATEVRDFLRFREVSLCGLCGL